MAAIKRKRSPVKRVSPIKPGFRGARNWAKAQVRAASYSRQGFWRLVFSCVVTVGAILFAALWLGGFLPDARQYGQNFVQARLVSMGFVVKNIDVLGDDHVREQDVLMAIGVYRGDYLFALDVEAAQDRVEALSWVDRAVVRRLWPNRIVVQLHEVREAGLWQYQGNVQVVDYNGNAITEADAAEFTYLPLLVGEKAGENIAQVNRVIDTYPDLASRVDAFVHFPSGRWDLHLDGGNMQVKLPKEGMEAAIVRLLKLHRDKKILDRQIGIIDLRLADRLSLTPQTAEPA